MDPSHYASATSTDLHATGRWADLEGVADEPHVSDYDTELIVAYYLV